MNNAHRFKKYIWLAIGSTVLLVALIGCRGDQLPNELKEAKVPLILIAKTEVGVIISDGENKIYSYNEGYYFAKILMASELKAGDVISGN